MIDVDGTKGFNSVLFSIQKNFIDSFPCAQQWTMGKSQGTSSVLPKPVRINLRSLNEKIMATTTTAASISGALLCSGHCVYIIFYYPQRTLREMLITIIPVSQMRRQGPERLLHLSMLAQQWSGRARIWTQAISLQGQCHEPHRIAAASTNSGQS